MSFIQRLMKHLVFLSFLIILANCEWGTIGYNQGYKPDQPIPFSHKLHAGEYKMACVYCHTQVETAKHSAVPSLNICMNCHQMVKTDSEHIQKLQAKFNNGETMNWVKVHMLPDHVKFNHKRHVQRFSTPDDRFQSCKKCHGAVDTMDVIEQVSSLSMGWCVNCHREESPAGPLNCSTCHN